MRIFHLVVCLIFLFFVSRLDAQNISSRSLECNVKFLNALRKSLSKDVFSAWPLHERFSSIHDLHFNGNDFWSIIKHRDNERLRRIAERILRGDTVNAVAYGGSNTAGGGIQEDEKSIEGRFPNVFQGWWENVITPVTGSRLNMKIIGIGGTSSSFYQFCYKVYLNDTNIDLALLDSSVNDGIAIRFQNSTANQSLPLEQFTRQLLNEASKPAVMFVNFFFTMRRWLGCFNLMDLGQSLISNHYHITTFHLRNLACVYKLGKFQITSKAIEHQTSDKYHMSLLGHAQAAFMIIQVISYSIRKLLNDTSVLTNKNVPGCSTVSLISSDISKYEPLPSPKYIKPPPSIIKNPLCWTGLTPDYKKKMIWNTLKVSVFKTKGFVYNGNVPILSPSHHGKAYRTDSFSCWCGTKIGSEIIFSLVVPELSSINLITRSSRDSGKLEVWLDQHVEEHVRIYPKHGNRQTVVITVATGVQPGNHTLTVRVAKEGNVPVVGIAVGM